MNEPAQSPPKAARTAAHVLAAVLPPGTTPRPLYRAGWPTPYAAETIVEDALHAGRGTELHVTVPLAAEDAVLEDVRQEFGWLSARGIHVLVHRALAE